MQRSPKKHPCFLLALPLAVGLLAAGSNGNAQPPRPTAPRPAGAPPAAVAKPTAPPAAASAGAPSRADEQAVRQTADAACKAFNAGDAKGLAALFTMDGEIIDTKGNKFRGRARVEQDFAQLFALSPGSQMDISIDSIRFLSPTVALEEGSSTVTDPRDHSTDRSRYRAIHVKQANGQWLMASVNDFADEPTTAKHTLEELSWLVGEWVDEDPRGLMKTNYQWTDNHVYLISDFALQVAGRTTMNGTQRICWDPVQDKLHSWVFDSEGGFLEGLWTQRGDQWIVKLQGVSRDGRVSSATQVITRLSKDRYSLRSRDRIIGDEAQPDLAEVIVARRPPGPELSDLPRK
jgi:uncharacterized protein (TIGR02246 family)